MSVAVEVAQIDSEAPRLVLAHVRKAVEATAKQIGAPVRLTGFVRYALGEGIERKQADFAAEVAATAGLGKN